MPADRERSESTPRYYNWLMFAVALLAVIGTAMSIVLQVRSKKAQLTVQISSAEELTSPKNVPDLVVTSSFRDKSVQRLWKIDLTIVNSGDRTLIGAGPQSNLIGTDISLRFSEWASILSGTIPSDDVNASVDKDAKEENKFHIKFDQWRSKEVLRLSFYVSAPEDKTQTPTILPGYRSIVDGDIVVKSVEDLTARQKQPLLDLLPPALAIPAKMVAVVSCLAGALLLFLTAWKAAADFFFLLTWRKRFALDFHFESHEQHGHPPPGHFTSPTTRPIEKPKESNGEKLAIWGPWRSARGAFAGFVISLILGTSILLFAASSFIKI